MADNNEKRVPEEKTDIDEILGSYDSLADDPTLESILAEFKGDAYIDGDKRTPHDELEKKADSIVEQYTGKRPDRSDKPKDIFDIKKPVIKTVSIKPEEEKDDADRWFEEFISGGNPAPITAKTPAMPEEPATADEAENITADEINETPGEKAEEAAPVQENDETEIDSEIVKPSDDYTQVTYAEPSSVEDFADDISRTVKNETDYGYYEERVKTRRKKSSRVYRDTLDRDVPDAMAESVRFAAPLHKLVLKAIAAGVICIIMTIFTLAFSDGKSLPFGIGTNMFAFTGVLMLMQMIVMLLGLDVLVSGVSDIVKGEPGAESLLCLSCLVTVIDGFVIFLRHFEGVGLPLCLVSSWAVFFAICGRKAYYESMKDSLRMLSSTSSPYGVVSGGGMDDHVILKKLSGMTDGFYSNLMQADIGETMYSMAAPILAFVSLVLAFVVSVGHGKTENFVHCFAIMLAVAAAFPSTMVFALPFKSASKSTKNSGGAIAGWGGACEIAESDSAIITDEDIFPIGTASVSGVRFLGDYPQDKAIVYTSSLIIESKSGLSKIFSDLLKEQRLLPIAIEDFACYEGGGIGALIDEDRVMVGSGAFMNLMGIRVPESINLNNSVFTAVNDRLVAVFSINYIPANSVQNALISLLNTRVDIMLAVRDFNVSPSMIQHKFKVSMEGVKIIPAETSYKVSDEKVPDGTHTSAVLCREGLGPFAEVITRGRLLKKITTVNSIISIAGSAVGLLLMFFLCWMGAFDSASPKNVLIFMMGIELCVFLLSKLVSSKN